MDENNRNDEPLIPRLTYPYLETLVIFEDYHHFPETGTTTCCIKVMNGFAITESASCGSANRFDFDIGKEKSRRKAMKRLMDYEQYLLKNRLYEARLMREDNTK